MKQGAKLLKEGIISEDDSKNNTEVKIKDNG